MNLGIIDRLKSWKEKALGSSASDVRALIRGDTFRGFATPSFRNLANEGFKCSELVFFIVNDIAQSGAGIPLLLDEQPDWVQSLMAMPQKPTENAEGKVNKQGKLYKKWMHEQLIFQQLSGSAYSQATTFGEGRRTTIEDMPIIRPDRITPQLRGNEEITGWHVTEFSSIKRFEFNQIFWSRRLDPLDDTKGFPPLGACNKALSQRNEIARLNMQVLKNDGAVKGIMKLLKMNDRLGKTPDLEEMKRIKREVNLKFGADADGEIAVTNWEMEWMEMGQKGKEMDWSKTKTQNAREIAIGNGYPPFLLGLADGATFNNVAAARQFLWNHTIIPWVEGMLCDMAVYFRMISGDMSIELKLDKKEILSIQEEMSVKRESDRKDWDSGLITKEEFRERNGFEANPTGEFKLDINRLSLPLDE